MNRLHRIFQMHSFFNSSTYGLGNEKITSFLFQHIPITMFHDFVIFKFLQKHFLCSKLFLLYGWFGGCLQEFYKFIRTLVWIIVGMDTLFQLSLYSLSLRYIYLLKLTFFTLPNCVLLLFSLTQWPNRPFFHATPCSHSWIQCVFFA